MFYSLFILVFALKCWSCNSETDKFCDDPFDSSKFTESENASLIECIGAYGEKARCAKVVQRKIKSFLAFILGEKTEHIIKRICTTRTREKLIENYETTRSAICNNDECNGSDA